MAWTVFHRAASRAGVEIAGHRNWDINAKRYRRLAERVRDSGADSVYIAGGIGANAGQLVRDLRSVLEPDVEIIAGHNFLPVPVLYATAGPAARGVLVTSPGPLTDALGPTGQEFVRAFGRSQLGHEVTSLDVFAAAATEVAAGRDRTLGRHARGRRPRAQADEPGESVLGPLTLDANGEPVSNRFTYVRVQHGGGRQDILNSTEGAEPVGTVGPSALVGG